MLGFSLAHGGGALLFLAPFLLCLWLLVALITMAVCLWRKRSLSRWYWLTLASAVVTLGVLSIPPAFWQWAFIGTFAKSPHAGDLMVYAAAEGDVRTVLGYLEHGVPVAATKYEGSTAAFTAAVGGSLPVIKMLRVKGCRSQYCELLRGLSIRSGRRNRTYGCFYFPQSPRRFQIRGTPGTASSCERRHRS